MGSNGVSTVGWIKEEVSMVNILSNNTNSNCKGVRGETDFLHDVNPDGSIILITQSQNSGRESCK